MERIKLRPHHVSFLKGSEKSDPLEKLLWRRLSKQLYGPRFIQTVYSLQKQIKPDTLIEIVQGNDYICTTLKCPYAPQCEIKDYEKVREELLQRLSQRILFVPKKLKREFYNKISKTRPDVNDTRSMYQHHIFFGQTYRFGDIREHRL